MVIVVPVTAMNPSVSWSSVSHEIDVEVMLLIDWTATLRSRQPTSPPMSLALMSSPADGIWLPHVDAWMVESDRFAAGVGFHDPVHAADQREGLRARGARDRGHGHGLAADADVEVTVGVGPQPARRGGHAHG